MTIIVWALSLSLVAEFVFAPVNLWRGRTTANFTRFTGFSTAAANRVFAPAKLATGAALTAGLVWSPFGAAGAAAALVISILYLVRLAHPSRRAPDGIAAFGLFGSLAAALLVVDLLR
jgi:hypothetical protein